MKLSALTRAMAACGALVCAASVSAAEFEPIQCAVGESVAFATGNAVSTYSEPSIRGMSQEAKAAQMDATWSWLMSDLAGLPSAASISVTPSAQDLSDIGDIQGVGLQAEPRRMRVGVDLSTDISVALSGINSAGLKKGGEMFNGGLLKRSAEGWSWTVSVGSTDATALRVHFTDFNLPVGASAYVFNSAGQAFGPYNDLGPLGTGEFWSHTVSGSQAFVQIRYFTDSNEKSAANVDFNIAGIGHIGSRFLVPQYTGETTKAFCSFNASCVENGECFGGGTAIDTARGGVAHMLFRSGRYYYICSGGLLADTDSGSQVPLFLTANHCISKGREASSLETFWDFTTPCNGGCYDPDGQVPSVLGASILSTNRTSDYTLMQLGGNPPSGSTYMGWTNSPVAFSGGTNLFRISHPAGAPQAYSEHVVDTGAGTCTSWPRGNWIYSSDSLGATEGGSSGSPVLNSAGQVVGQLSGGCGTNVNDSCDNVNNATVDGALAAYYDSVATWLDPAGGGGGGGGGGGSSMHVDSVSLSVTGNRWKRVRATITIVDESGNPVANASVNGSFSGDVSGSGSGTTDSNGNVTLTSNRTRNSVANVQFCVDAVSHGSLSYDSGANVETCDGL